MNLKHFNFYKKLWKKALEKVDFSSNQGLIMIVTFSTL